MRFVLAGTVALLCAPAAFAQTPPPPQCVTFTPAPAIPDGATATNTAMREARDALAAWHTTRRTELAACQVAAAQLEAQLRAAEAAHNTAAAETDAAIARFTAENDEYSARGATRPRRDGGVITRPGPDR